MSGLHKKGQSDVRSSAAALTDVLAGREVIPNIGQVKGAWKKALDKEVKAGRLVTWKGHWFPLAGASFGIGPLKTCYGTPEARDALPCVRRAVA